MAAATQALCLVMLLRERGGKGALPWRWGCPLPLPACRGPEGRSGATEIRKEVEPWAAVAKEKGKQVESLPLSMKPQMQDPGRAASAVGLPLPLGHTRVLSWWERESQNLKMKPLTWKDFMLLSRWPLPWRVGP